MATTNHNNTTISQHNNTNIQANNTSALHHINTLNTINPEMIDLDDDELKNLIKLPDEHSTPEFNINYTYKDKLDTYLKTNCELKDYVIIHINCRSLIKNVDSVIDLISCLQFRPDFIAISETKLNKYSDLNLIKINGYHFHHVDSLSSWGGVGLYIKNYINFNIRKDLSLYNENYESLWIQVDNPGNKRKTVLGVIYRHPRYIIKDFSETLSDLLLKLTAEKNDILITGDINIDLLKLDYNDSIREYYNMMNSYGFENYIKASTRITKESNTLIDHFYFNNNINSNTKTTIIIDDISDHFPILAIIKEYRTPQTHSRTPIFRRNYSNVNKESLYSDAISMLKNFYTQCLNLPNLDVHKQFKELETQFKQVIDKNVPLQKLSRKKEKRYSNPWINKDIQMSIKRKNNLYKRLCKNNFKNQNLLQNYKIQRNKLAHIIEASKQDYYKKLLVKKEMTRSKLGTY